MQSLKSADAIALDTETTGLRWPVDEMFGFSVAVDGWAEYYDIREQPQALEWLQDEINESDCPLVFHNCTFDIKMFSPVGIVIPVDRVHDTGINACLIDEHLGIHGGNSGYGLDELAKRYIGAKKVEDIYEALALYFGGRPTRNAQIGNLWRAPREIVAPYAIMDAVLTLDLYSWQLDEIEEQGIWQIVEFERRAIREVLDQEMKGIRVDVDRAEKARNEMAILIDQEKRKLAEVAGFNLNVNSSPQIKKYYEPEEGDNGKWYLPDGTECKTTSKGNASIDNDVLQSIRHKDPVADHIIKIRSMIRTSDTFLAKHILGSAVDMGDEYRVFPNINQVASEDGGTKTGRFSYTKPAMQQIPNRNKEVAAIVKPCFLPDQGQVWLDCDLSSFEVRIFAHLVARFNKAIAEQYAKNPNTDFHQYVSELMGVPRNPRPEGGANAKQLNLSMIFNSGNGSIAKQLGFQTIPASFTDRAGKLIRYDKPSPEAQKVIETYHTRVVGVKDLAKRAKEKAEKVGYVKTAYGRRLRFPKSLQRYTYKASGLLIQATSADINKENWWVIREALGDRGRLILNTHDSYSMSVDEESWKESWKDVKSAVEERDWLRVPLVLDFNGIGANWWGALQGK